MARIRSVKPEFWADPTLARLLSRDARLLYIGMWNFADEHARMFADVRLIKGQVFPYDDDLTPVGVAALLAEVQRAGKIVPYSAGGEDFFFLPTLHKHQRLDADKVASRHPAPGSVRINPDPGADKSGSDPEKSALLYVAGSMEHGAGNGPTTPGTDVVPIRQDVERICSHLADRIEGNGSNRPVVSQSWRDSARLLIDKDGRTEDQVHNAIDWCQAHDFWRGAVMSMPKLRKQYDRLRLEAQRGGGSRQSDTDAMFDRAMRRAESREVGK